MNLHKKNKLYKYLHTISKLLKLGKEELNNNDFDEFQDTIISIYTQCGNITEIINRED